MKRTLLLLSTLLLVIMVACNNKAETPAVTDEPEVNTGDPKEPEQPAKGVPIMLSAQEFNVAQEGNDFGINVFRKLTAQKKENLILSPLSLSLDLSLCAGGAGGETRTQMLSTLGFANQQAEDVAGYYKKVTEGLLKVDPASKFMSANSVWTDLDYPLSSAFSSYAGQWYNASLTSLDLSKKESLTKINQWCKDNTEGLIDKMLDDSKDPENKAASYLLNALYFKGAWAFDFDENPTVAPFHGTDGDVSASYLTVARNFSYQEAKQAQWVSLPFGSHAFSLALALPAEGVALKDFMATVTADDFFFTGNDPVKLQVPSFTMEGMLQDNLKDALKDLGMTLPFDATQADFYNMFEPNFLGRFFIGLIAQKLHFQMDKKGAEAAAVTVIGMETTCIPDEPEATPRVFIANRPFVFALVENTSHTILFLGQKMQ